MCKRQRLLPLLRCVCKIPSAVCKSTTPKNLLSIRFFSISFSVLKIKIWIHVQRKFPIVFFDATGGVLKNIAKQCPPLIYSMIVYDYGNKSYLPIAEFITTSHCQLNLSLYLYEVKFQMEKYISVSNKNYKFPLPFLFIVDQSFTIISSIFSIFGGINISEFLLIAFNVIIQNEISVASRFQCLVYLCKIHLLKNVLKKAKIVKHSKKEAEIKAKKLLGFCFTLLQEAESVDEFECVLRQTFDIFCLPR